MATEILAVNFQGERRGDTQLVWMVMYVADGLLHFSTLGFGKPCFLKNIFPALGLRMWANIRGPQYHFSVEISANLSLYGCTVGLWPYKMGNQNCVLLSYNIRR